MSMKAICKDCGTEVEWPKDGRCEECIQKVYILSKPAEPPKDVVTWAPVRAAIKCIGRSGDYVRKEDYEAMERELADTLVRLGKSQQSTAALKDALVAEQAKKKCPSCDKCVMEQARKAAAKREDPPFKVTCDETTNTEQDIKEGKIRAKVELAVPEAEERYCKTPQPDGLCGGFIRVDDRGILTCTRCGREYGCGCDLCQVNPDG